MPDSPSEQRCNTSVGFRLTARQLDTIRPGLQRITQAHRVWTAKKQPSSAYPLGVFPIRDHRRKGVYNVQMMAEVESAWRKLSVKTRSGARLRMDAIEIRAAILGIRIEQDYRRTGARRTRQLDENTRRRFELDKRSRLDLQKRSSRVILTLERHLKRANRRLLAVVGEADYQALVAHWQAHLRWIRVYLVYFRPLPLMSRRKRQQRLVIDAFVELARRGLIAAGYAGPAPEPLRRMMRLFVRYMRRGRLPFSLQYMLATQNATVCRRVLANFVRDRLDLPEQKSR